MSVTRVFRRRPELERQRGRIANDATAVAVNPMLRADTARGEGFDAKALFVERYSIIKKALDCHRSQGVLILAFDQQKTALAEAWIAASLDRTRTAVVGRHSMCSIPIAAEHESVSLRHLAVLVRAISHSEVRIRVLDLHTQMGFADESGRVLQAVVCEGSMFLSVGEVKLCLLVTDDSDVSDDPEAQYATIPERVFLEERRGTAGDPDMRALGTGLSPSRSFVQSAPGPLAAAGKLVGPDEQPLGTMIVRSSGGAVRRSVGASIVERGLLVGRYARCDVGVSFSDDSRLSRVHMLLVRDGGDLLAVDTASINGTFVGGKAILQQALEEGMTFDLGGELSMTWHFE